MAKRSSTTIGAAILLLALLISNTHLAIDGPADINSETEVYWHPHQPIGIRLSDLNVGRIDVINRQNQHILTIEDRNAFIAFHLGWVKFNRQMYEDCLKEGITDCTPPKQSDLAAVHWSPNGEYVAIGGEGFITLRFIRVDQLLSGKLPESAILNVLLFLPKQGDDGIDIALYEYGLGWSEDNHYYFTAGLSGLQQLFRYTPTTKRLIGGFGIPTADSDVNEHIQVKMKDYEVEKFGRPSLQRLHEQRLGLEALSTKAKDE